MPYVSKQWLEEAADGVIALSAGVAGDVGQALLGDKGAWLPSGLATGCDFIPGAFTSSFIAPAERAMRSTCTRR